MKPNSIIKSLPTNIGKLLLYCVLAISFQNCGIQVHHSGTFSQCDPMQPAIYSDEKESNVSLSGSYITNNKGANNETYGDSNDYRTPQSIELINIELGWSTTEESFHYGFSANIYYGNHFMNDFYGERVKSEISGACTKGLIGVQIPFSKINLRPINYQLSLAWDWSEYAQLRDDLQWLNQFGTNLIVPKDATSIGHTIFIEIDLLKHNEFSFGAKAGFIIHDYYSKGMHRAYETIFAGIFLNYDKHYLNISALGGSSVIKYTYMF